MCVHEMHLEIGSPSFKIIFEHIINNIIAVCEQNLFENRKDEFHRLQCYVRLYKHENNLDLDYETFFCSDGHIDLNKVHGKPILTPSGILILYIMDT